MIEAGRGLEYGLLGANVCFQLMRFAADRGGRVALRPAAQLGDGLTPDLIYLAAETLAAVSDLEAPLHSPPDLVVEIVTATAAWTAVEALAADYVRHGVPLIWIVDPYSQCVHVYGAGRDNEIVTGGEVLPGDQVLPGWTASAADLLGA